LGLEDIGITISKFVAKTCNEKYFRISLLLLPKKVSLKKL